MLLVCQVRVFYMVSVLLEKHGVSIMFNERLPTNSPNDKM